MKNKLNILNKKNDLFSKAKKFKNLNDFINSLGTPIFHGTNRSFKKFSLKYVKESSGRSDRGLGIYFTDNKSLARQYANNDNNVYEVFVENLSDFLEWNEPLKKKKHKEIIYNIIEKFFINKEKYPEKGLIPELYNNIRNKNTFGIIYENLTCVVDEKELIKYFHENGIPGILSSDSSTSHLGLPINKVYTVFNDKNIKTKEQIIEIYNEAHK